MGIVAQPKGTRPAGWGNFPRLICTTRIDRDEQKAGWWRNVTAKGQFCDFFDKAIAMLA
jgi:hypothetical protein